MVPITRSKPKDIKRILWFSENDVLSFLFGFLFDFLYLFSSLKQYSNDSLNVLKFKGNYFLY